MAMVVNHNIPALSTYNVVNSTSSALQKSINKLSTGLRINSAADDAAGLAISEKMRAQVRGLDQAVSNSQDGISMIQTAEGALSETHSILQRMRELSVQAANDTLTQQDRGYIQEEVDQLREEITRIGNTTQFNKKKLLNGDAAVLWSSSDNETKALIKGGLRTIDQFGQKSSVEGNYNIKIKADPGQAEVQKSDIMKIKHPDVVMNKNTNSEFVADVAVKNVPAGNYTLSAGTAQTTNVVQTGHFGIGATKNSTDTKFTFSALTGSGQGAKDTVSVKLGNKVIWTGNISNSSGVTEQVEFFTKNKAEIIKAAKDNGVELDFDDNDTFTTSTYDGTKGPEVTIDYGAQADPTKVASVASGSPETKSFGDIISVAAATGNGGAGKMLDNASVLFEVTGVDTTNDTIKVKATANVLKADGTTETKTLDELTLKGGEDKDLSKLLGVSGAKVSLQQDMSSYVKVGGKWVSNISGDGGSVGTNAIGVDVKASIDSTWDGKWNNGPQDDEVIRYTLDKQKVAGNDVHFKNFYLNSENGEVSEGDIIMSTKDGFKNVKGGDFLASFDAAYIGKVASGDVKLRDLDKFWDSEGNFMLTDPQTITITQGDGKSASVTLSANDTLNDVANKFNTAISEGLGQGKYVDDASKFATFTSEPDLNNNSQSVRGTFLLRSVVPGSNGTLSLSGAENVINAFSLNTVQKATETSYTANIKDAHTGAVVASDVKVTGNKLVGVIHENVDVEFDSMAGLSATWDGAKKAYTYNAMDYDTTLHLSDNTTVFQIGANEGEDMGVNIGDMRSHALGLDEVNVTNRDRAARSITVIDGAIDKVSMQRAKLGAYQNRLEHTINNLTTASENLTAAESRIRDTDMAKEMMNFSKLQIMLQAGNSMLAQANQLPQNVLSLVR